MKPWQNPAHDVDPDNRTDQLHLLALFLELQLDLLLIALRPADAADPGTAAGPGTPAGPRWDGETLDLTDVDPEPDQREWLTARYTALAEAIDEMLGNPEVRRNPAVAARLRQARETCSERLGALPAPQPDVASPEAGALIEAGHYLG